MILNQSFEKIKKKYALSNSYFKNRRPQDPSNPFEVLEYYKENNELPFGDGTVFDNWFYDCFIEYQKRAGVYQSQFFTPPSTAEKIAELANIFFKNDVRVLDACCGFGMLSKAVREKGFIVNGFDVNPQFEKVYGFHTEGQFFWYDFRDYSEKHKCIIANPPYEIKELTEFLGCLANWLTDDGIAILLLPAGFISKERPKQLVENLNSFIFYHIEPMQESFARTNIRAEIVVARKKR